MKTIYPEGEGKKVLLQAQVEPTWRQHEAKSERRQSEDGPKIGVEPKVQTSRSAKTYSKTHICCYSQGRWVEEKLEPRWGHIGPHVGPNGGQHEASLKPRWFKMRPSRSQGQAKTAQDEGRRGRVAAAMTRPWSPDGGNLAARFGEGAGFPSLLGGFLEPACDIGGASWECLADARRLHEQQLGNNSAGRQDPVGRAGGQFGVSSDRL